MEIATTPISIPHPIYKTDELDQFLLNIYQILKTKKIPVLGFIYEAALNQIQILLPIDWVKEISTLNNYTILDWDNFLESPLPFWLIDEKGKLNRMEKD